MRWCRLRRFYVERIGGDNVEVLLLPHKDGSGYSYVNLTKGHICPCKFKTAAEAIADMLGKENLIRFHEIPNWKEN